MRSWRRKRDSTVIDLVLDASVAVEWYSPSPDQPDLHSYAGPLRQAALEGAVRLHVPQIFEIEVSARLLRLYRRSMLSRGRLETAVIPLQIHSFVGASAPDYVSIGMRWHLAVYDAVYFALTQRLEYPLATIDGGLLRAIETFGKTDGVMRWAGAI